ncbi:MAG: short-chain dehydrogenase/reductase [Paracoccaceae bacterium]|nr:short-chain dehydrogenase/reductase [Paracoccaceae bacterium]
MNLNLSQKRVVITGGSKGIGYAIAEAFLREGAEVIIIARNAKTLELAAQNLFKLTGRNPAWYSFDLSDLNQRKLLHQTIGEIDILVNNAGAIPGGDLFSLKIEDWLSSWNLKVFGYIHLCQLFLSKMKLKQSGTVINIIGMGGRAVRSNYICGAGGNAALIGFTNAIGSETPDYNVRVFGINPSPTLTDRMIQLFKVRAAKELGDAKKWDELVNSQKLPFGRVKSPDEVAALTVMLSSNKVHYLSGTVIDLDGGSQWRS